MLSTRASMSFLPYPFCFLASWHPAWTVAGVSLFQVQGFELVFFELPENSASPVLWLVKVPLTGVLLSSVLLALLPQLCVIDKVPGCAFCSILHPPDKDVINYWSQREARSSWSPVGLCMTQFFEPSSVSFLSALLSTYLDRVLPIWL